MTILQKPASLNLSGNLPKFVISADDDVDFVLKKGEETLLSSVYSPGVDNKITVDVRDIVENALSFDFKNVTTPYAQSELAADFTASIGPESVHFRCVRAGVDKSSVDANIFLKSNFLTWQPQVKKVMYSSPEYLTLYPVESCQVKVKAYFDDDNEETITLYGATKDVPVTIPVQYAVIVGKFSNRTPSFYDVWAETSSGVRLTYIQRYVASDLLSEEEQWILFENSLGGIDTFRAYGTFDFSGEHTYNIAEIEDVSEEYRIDVERNFEKNTGYLNDYERKWLLDFFSSRGKYICADNTVRRIVCTDSSVDFNQKELPSSYTFTYRYADAKPYLNLQRIDNLPEVLNVHVPDLGSFTIPPRLVEFPQLNVTEGVLIPAQFPFKQEWGTVTLYDILSYVLSYVYTESGSGGDGDIYLIKLGDTTIPTDYNTFSALRILQEINVSISDLHNIFLHKNQPDQTNFLIKFLKGLELGKYTTGLLGTGGAILIDEDGNSHAEFDYLNIRKKALFTEITVQELKHIGGALIISPAAMIISSVEETEEGYKCFFDKKNSDGKTIYNEFEPGDQGRCQTFNLEKQENGQVGNRYWWRLVVATGDDYVVFSKTDADIESDIPAAGDEVAQLGNRNDKTRQNAQIYTAYGSDSPSRKMYQGIDSYKLVGKIIKDEYYDVTSGRFKEVTYGDAYFGDENRKNYFENTVEGGVEVKGKVHIESGSDGWENIVGLSGAFDDAYQDINAAKDAADKAQTAADDAKEEAQGASDRLDEWASDGVISPTEKLALKQEIQNLQAEYDTNLKNAEKYGIDCSLYKSKWESYKAELEYHSADTPENIPIRDSFRSNQPAFYTSRTELLTAIAEASKEYADKLVASISVGAENLLLNTGFTGNYEDEKLSSSYKLTPTSLLYSNRMFAWEGKAEIVEDKDSVSGFSAVVGNLSQSVSTIPVENYVVSYRAKGNSVTVTFGGSTYTQPLTSSYVRYVHRFTSGSSSFSISGDATVCELKLERGTVATDWCPSRKDRNEVADRFKYFWYLQDALQSATQVYGGLVLTTMIMVGKFVDGVLQKVNAGISGIYNDDTDVAVWAGGTYEDAIRTVQTLIANPNYQPSEQEWKSMAKFVATHGGDTFIRGYIYALGGIFRGIIYAQGGEFGGYLKTTFKDLYESDAVKGTYSVKTDDDTSKNVSGYKLVDDLNISTAYAHDIIVLPNDSKYIGAHVNISNANVPPYSRTSAGYYTEIYAGKYPYGIGGGYLNPSEDTESEYIRKLQGGMMQFVGVPKEMSGAMYTQWICLTPQVKEDEEFQESLQLRNSSGSMTISPDDIHFTTGATTDKGYTGEVLVQEAELAADRIYLTFKNGIMVGTRKGG